MKKKIHNRYVRSLWPPGKGAETSIPAGYGSLGLDLHVDAELSPNEY